MVKKLFIRTEKDPISGKKSVLETRKLFDSDNIISEIIEDFPEIIPTEGMTGSYEYDETGKLQVVYKERDKTEVEKLKQDLEKTNEALAEMSILLGTIATPNVG